MLLHLPRLSLMSFSKVLQFSSCTSWIFYCCYYDWDHFPSNWLGKLLVCVFHTLAWYLLLFSSSCFYSVCVRMGVCFNEEWLLNFTKYLLASIGIVLWLVSFNLLSQWVTLKDLLKSELYFCIFRLNPTFLGGNAVSTHY